MRQFDFRKAFNKNLNSNLIRFISRLDFKPPGEKILSNLKEIVRNAEVSYSI